MAIGTSVEGREAERLIQIAQQHYNLYAEDIELQLSHDGHMWYRVCYVQKPELDLEWAAALMMCSPGIDVLFIPVKEKTKVDFLIPRKVWAIYGKD